MPGEIFITFNQSLIIAIELRISCYKFNYQIFAKNFPSRLSNLMFCSDFYDILPMCYAFLAFYASSYILIKWNWNPQNLNQTVTESVVSLLYAHKLFLLRQLRRL